MNVQKLRVLGSFNEPPAPRASYPKEKKTKKHFLAVQCGFSDHSTLIEFFGRVGG